MRLKQSRLKQYSHRAAILKKDNEGNSYIEYDQAELFRAETWAAGGKVQAERYGKRLPNIRNIRIEGDYTELSNLNGGIGYAVCSGTLFIIDDGICMFVAPDAEPDYKVVAIYPYNFLTLEVERIQ